MQSKILFNRILLPLLLLATCGANAGGTLHVAAGQSHVIAQSPLKLDELVLDDGAQLSFAPGVAPVSISATRARIGNHVRIVASGKSGNRGADGRSYATATGSCEAGANGGDGAAGDSGRDGLAVTVELGVDAIGSLRIESEGGDGGAGGSGGGGQAGGAIERCYGKDGGAGGAGGDGGRGGNGGAVTLRYWHNNMPQSDVSQTVAQLAQAFSVSVRAGLGGSGGKGGAGGAVAAGRYLSTSFGGGKKWLASGQVGTAGAAGRAGATGNAGAVSLSQQALSAASTPAPASANTLPAPRAATMPTVSRQEFEALQSQLQRLESRIRALEAAQP